MKLALAMVLLALSAGACGTRTNLGTADAAPFVDDDHWLKLDGGADSGARRDGPSERGDGDAGAVPDVRPSIGVLPGDLHGRDNLVALASLAPTAATPVSRYSSPRKPRRFMARWMNLRFTLASSAARVTLPPVRSSAACRYARS